MSDYKFEFAPSLSPKAIDELTEIRKLDFDKRSKFFMAFCEKYKDEIKERDEANHRNISNFCHLVNSYLDNPNPDVKKAAREQIETYRDAIGFHIWKDERGRTHFKCKYYEAMRLVNEYQMSQYDQAI